MTFRPENHIMAQTTLDRLDTGGFCAKFRSLRHRLMVLTPAIASTLAGSAGAQPSNSAQPTNPAEAAAAVVLFDGKSLEGWRIVDTFDFVDHGQVSVKDGVIYLERGKPATGISWKGEFPRSNYQLTLTAQRVEGNDFFCGLTFPVKGEYCTLILGGWGGSIVGLSNINGNSAVENATTQAIEFEQGRWYKIKLTVTDDNITIMLDNKAVIDVETKDRRFTIYWEQEPVTPLGIVTWNTTGAIKDLKLVNLGGPINSKESAPAQP
jgi:hypothetical protein